MLPYYIAIIIALFAFRNKIKSTTILVANKIVSKIINIVPEENIADREGKIKTLRNTTIGVFISIIMIIILIIGGTLDKEIDIIVSAIGFYAFYLCVKCGIKSFLNDDSDDDLFIWAISSVCVGIFLFLFPLLYALEELINE